MATYKLIRNKRTQNVEVVLTVFWDAKGESWIGFFTSGTINAVRYCDTLTKLMSAIQRKRPGLLSRGISFLDDNARPNTARNAKEDILRLVWDIWYGPEYSSDLARSDFKLFPASH
ncbi:hypothetical protein AVEN_140713-1 [Araneus ventricosus]|uniref:Mariner Mos1 transposase n=1 Tax=Araneus ventricosus TaxID=182803 RepID=A0A4Y2KFR4_ARAVE|nr:hypothetical protein AVEN_140713-1 [Araneus ventricosus]